MVFYVGKGCGDRYKSSCYKSSPNKRKQRILNEINESKHTPIIKFVYTNLTELEAYRLEAEEIGRWGRIGYEPFGTLTNVLLGGEKYQHSVRRGFRVSDETKQKMRQAKLGVPKERGHADKLRSILQTNSFKGPHTEETKIKLRKPLLNYPKTRKSVGSPSEETRMKMRKPRPSYPKVRKPPTKKSNLINIIVSQQNEISRRNTHEQLDTNVPT